MDEIKLDQHEEETGLFDCARVLFKHKKLIIWIVLIAVVATAVISLLMTKVYESRAVIAPVQQPAVQSSMSVIAAQFGIAAPQSSNVSEMVNLLKSDILMQKILEKYNLYEVFFKKDALRGKSENQKAWLGIRFLKEGVLKITENKKDQTIVVAARYKDPAIAEKIASATLNELTDYMSGEAKRVAEANRKHLEAQVEKTADPFVRQKIYSLIAQQIENAMMAEVKENFAFKMIDPPRVPDRRVSPRRTQMVIMAFVISLFLGIFLAFAWEYLQKNREEWGELAKMDGLKKMPWKRSGNKENNI